MLKKHTKELIMAAGIAITGCSTDNIRDNTSREVVVNLEPTDNNNTKDDNNSVVNPPINNPIEENNNSEEDNEGNGDIKVDPINGDINPEVTITPIEDKIFPCNIDTLDLIENVKAKIIDIKNEGTNDCNSTGEVKTSIKFVDNNTSNGYYSEKNGMAVLIGKSGGIFINKENIDNNADALNIRKSERLQIESTFINEISSLQMLLEEYDKDIFKNMTREEQIEFSEVYGDLKTLEHLNEKLKVSYAVSDFDNFKENKAVYTSGHNKMRIMKMFLYYVEKQGYFIDNPRYAISKSFIKNNISKIIENANSMTDNDIMMKLVEMTYGNNSYSILDYVETPKKINDFYNAYLQDFINKYPHFNMESPVLEFPEIDLRTVTKENNLENYFEYNNSNEDNNNSDNNNSI